MFKIGEFSKHGVTRRPAASVTAFRGFAQTRGHAHTLRSRRLAKHVLQSRSEGPRMAHIAYMVAGKLHDGCS